MLRTLKFGLAVAAALGFSAVAAGMTGANAATFEIFGTGLDAAGNPLAIGASDPHYQVVETSTAAQVRTDIHENYLDNDATSQWVWQLASGQPTGVTRTFRTTFDLTGYDHTQAVINGAWGTDNEGLEVRLNGVDTNVAQLLGANIAHFSSLTAFTIATGFVAGINTLDFVINDLGGSQAAFRASLSGTAPVPLPAALPLFAAGLAGFGALRLRKRKKAVAAA